MPNGKVLGQDHAEHRADAQAIPIWHRPIICSSPATAAIRRSCNTPYGETLRCTEDRKHLPSSLLSK
eukprot:11078009-Alexandrium_andersonii.AAC.1